MGLSGQRPFFHTGQVFLFLNTCVLVIHEIRLFRVAIDHSWKYIVPQIPQDIFCKPTRLSADANRFINSIHDLVKRGDGKVLPNDGVRLFHHPDESVKLEDVT